MQFKESETLELKKSTSELKEAIIAISAMLNKHGQGVVIFGIDDKGKVAGQDIGKTTIADISRSISDHIEPKIFPAIHEETIEGKQCVRVVASGNEMPYFAFGRAHTRVGDKNPVLSSRELEWLFEKKDQGRHRWDDKPCPNAKSSDIDPVKLRAFLKKANLDFKSVGISLLKLGLMTAEGGITNAAILLFGISPQNFFPHIGLRGAVFIGNATFLDMKDFQGDLFTQIENAEGYVMKNIHIGERLERFTRIDVPEIDKTALREAIINAFCHRDYNIPDTIDLAVFSDRVEIRSPGLLFGGLTIGRILKGEVSERRNLLIADMLHRIHFVEKWGRGIKTILEKEPTASFKETGRHFITVFRRKKDNLPHDRVDGKNAPLGSAEKLPVNYQSTTIQLPGKYGRTARRIIQEIGLKPETSAKELSKKIGISEDGVRFALKQLKNDGWIRHLGPNKGGRWEIIQK